MFLKYYISLVPQVLLMLPHCEWKNKLYPLLGYPLIIMCYGIALLNRAIIVSRALEESNPALVVDFWIASSSK